MNLDGFSMRPLVAELSEKLTGGRIDKIFQQSKSNFTFTVRQPGQSFLVKISTAPQNPSIYITESAPENLPEPPTFCMVLRKNLESGRIAAIRRHELDRIIFIDVDSIGAGGKIQTVTLVAELIGKYSNLILISEGTIIAALKKIGTNTSRVRTVLPGQIYQMPPAQDKLDIFKTGIDEIVAGIKNFPELRIDKAIMNVCQGFGPQSVKETIFSAGFSTEIKISDLDDSDFKSLAGALEEIRDSAKNPAPCIVKDAGKILAISAVKLNYFPKAEIQIFDTISEMLEKADKIAGSYTPPDKERFSKLVHNELRRAENKISVLQNELETAENADEQRILADNLSTYRYQFRDHADDEIVVADIYGENGESIKIPLDRRLTIAANIQNMYKKYDKLKRATRYISEQLEKCRAEISYLSGLEHSLNISESLAEIEEIKSELVAGGYLKEAKKKSSSGKKAEPFEFTAPDGTKILVGKNNSQNDRLTFKIAAPTDIWLHTKEITGSHVIIRTEGGEVSDENLLLAAQIAVYFSKAQGSSNVPVDYVLCKFVKKPSGAKPGFVVFTNQKTIYVTPENETLEKVLKTGDYILSSTG